MNTNELRKVLASEIHAVRAGKSKPQRAGSVSKLAGQFIASAKLDLAYAKAAGVKPHYPFINGGKALPALKKNGRG